MILPGILGPRTAGPKLAALLAAAILIAAMMAPAQARSRYAELVVDGGLLIGSGAAYENYFASRGGAAPERDIRPPSKA